MVIDPFDESIGLKLPLTLRRNEFDILLATHEHKDHSNIKAVGGKPFLVDGPGEYEIKGVFIHGIPGYHDSEEGKTRGEITIFTIEAEDIRICHLSDLGQKKLLDEQVEKIGDIDILMIPVGGGPTINAGQAQEVINQIEPRIIIPMHYQLPKLAIKLDSVNKFLSVMGKKKIEPVEKFTIKKKDLPSDGAEIVVLRP